MIHVLVSLAIASAPSAADLLQEGVRLRLARRDAEALEKFQLAYRLSRGSQALAQIALAEQALGRWLDAEAHLTKALKDRQHPWIQKNRGPLSDGLRAIRKRLVSVDVRTSVPGARIRINGRAIGKSPLSSPARAVAGTIVVEVTADGYWPMSRQLELPGGTVARETFVLVEKPAPPLVSEPPSLAPDADAAPLTTALQDNPPSLRPYAYAAGAATLAAAGAGAALLIVRNNHARSWNQCVADEALGPESCEEDRDAVRMTELASGLTFGAAGLLATTAALLFLFDSSDNDDHSATRSPSMANPPTTCHLALSTVGVGCIVRF